MKSKKILLFTSLFLLLPLFSHAYTFNTNLKVGDRGPDVLELQKFLNLHSTQTKVASLGPGSPGSETDFFGSLTHNAVIRLQNLYRSEILAPVGLSSGTGYFGPSTRAKVNLSNNTTGSVETTSTPSTEQPIIQDINTVEKIIYVSNFTPRQGEIISIYGEGIRNQTLYLGGVIIPVDCEADFVCQYQIRSDQTPGTYKLYVLKDGVEDESVLINIIDGNGVVPEIFVNKIVLNQDNLIKGRNLTPTITIQSIFGSYQSETLNNQFILAPQVEVDVLPDYLKRGFIRVVNSDGTMGETLTIDYEK
jgi:hypothetical protein